jgi:hypothetical protein
MTENIKIIWTDTETKEEKEIFSFDTSLAGLWHLKDLILTECKRTSTREAPEIDSAFIGSIERLEKSAILLALDQNGWNKKATAKKLGMKRTTLVELIGRWKMNETDAISKKLLPLYIQDQLGSIAKDLIRTEIKLLTNKIIEERITEFNANVSDKVTRIHKL